MQLDFSHLPVSLMLQLVSHPSISRDRSQRWSKSLLSKVKGKARSVELVKPHGPKNNTPTKTTILQLQKPTLQLALQGVPKSTPPPIRRERHQVAVKRRAMCATRTTIQTTVLVTFIVRTKPQEWAVSSFSLFGLNFVLLRFLGVFVITGYVANLTQEDKDVSYNCSVSLGAKDADPGEHLGPFLVDIIANIPLQHDPTIAIPVEDLAGMAETILGIARHKGFTEYLKTGKLHPATCLVAEHHRCLICLLFSIILLSPSTGSIECRRPILWRRTNLVQLHQRSKRDPTLGVNSSARQSLGNHGGPVRPLYSLLRSQGRTGFHRVRLQTHRSLRTWRPPYHRLENAGRQRGRGQLCRRRG